MKISYANTLAEICEKIDGADVDDITRALGADRRISPHYLKGGLSFGGPCFPRDNREFAAFARRHGCQAPLAEATDSVNRQHIESTVQRIVQSIDGDRGVGVLGLAYKPNTPVIEESPAVRMVTEFLKRGLRVTVYDPLALPNVRAIFSDSIDYADSVADCVARAPICLIATPCDEFRQVEQLAHNPMTIIDCWRLLDPTKFKTGVKYVALGRTL
jgi:UDPglucose 6-dehydrogenase